MPISDATEPAPPSHWRWFTVLWLLTLPGALFVCADTFLRQTRESGLGGPDSPQVPWAVTSVALLGLGLVSAGLTALWRLMRGGSIPRLVRRQIVSGAVIFAVLLCPAIMWRIAIISTIGPTDRGPEWMASAAKANDVFSMKILAARGVDVNAHPKPDPLLGPSWVERAPLAAASEYGAMAAVAFLLDRGANPSAEPSAVTAAAEGTHHDIFDLLLNHGAAVPCKDTALRPPPSWIGRDVFRFEPDGRFRDLSLERDQWRTDSTIDDWTSKRGISRPICA